VRVLLFLAVMMIAAPAGARAQADDLAGRTIRSVTFEGRESISRSVLADSIVTQRSRCRGLILRPVCAVTKAEFAYEEHELDPQEVSRDVLRIRVIYFRKGYRQAEVTSSVTPRDDDAVDVTFTIAEGPLTTIGSMTVAHTREVLTERQMGSMGVPQSGPLDLTQLDSAKIRIRNALWDRGYADADVRDSTTIDPATHVAAVGLTIDPKPLAIIDSVAIDGNETVSDRTVERVLGLQPGQVFRRTDVTAAQRRLFDTEIFRQSVVRVPPSGDSAKALVVTVEEAPPRALRLGAGFNTTDFVQSEVRFIRYNWLGDARRLDMRAAVGNLLASQLNGRTFFADVAETPFGGEVDPIFLRPTWQAGVQLTQPFFLSTHTSLGLGFSVHRRIVPGITVDRGFAADGSLTHRLAEGVPISVTYRFERAHFEAGDLYFCVNFGVCDPATVGALRKPHRLAPLGLTARIERADDPIAPTSGFMGRVEVEHASRLTGSSFHYQRVAGEASQYYRFANRRTVLAGVVRAGWVRPLGGTFAALGIDQSDLGVLHPRRRLLSGGARSIRGYAENQMGPKVLTVPSRKLIQPPSDTGTPACTLATIADRSCDPNAAPDSVFRSRPLGGNTLLEGSVELRFPLNPTFVAAVFVDAGVLRGQRLNFPPGSRSAITPGLGVRYQSPIGPVRVDLGIKTRVNDELPVVTELVDANGEPRLVQLEKLAQYDPHADAGTLRKLLGRLQLHLAIGEAF
jgi:outer membrane protein assembly factor BamA